MKILYWLLGLFALSLVAYSWFGVGPPRIINVAGALLDEWYRGRTLVAGLVGAAWGVAWGFRVSGGRWRLRHKPHQTGDAFNSRVALSGVWGLLIAGLLWGPLVLVVSSLTADFVPLAVVDRIVDLLFAMKTLGVIAAAVLGTWITYAVTTRARTWGGQLALLPTRNE